MNTIFTKRIPFAYFQQRKELFCPIIGWGFSILELLNCKDLFFLEFVQASLALGIFYSLFLTQARI